MNARHDSGIYFAIMNIIETIEGINKIWRLDNNVVKILIS